MRSYAAATAVVVASIGVAMVLRRLPHSNLSLLFLLAVLITAARWGLGPSLFAGVLSFLVLNYLFTAPPYTLSVADEGDVATLFFFLAAAVVTGRLAARMRTEAASNRAALDRVSTLLDFSRRMTAAQNARQVLQTLADRLSAICAATVAALLPEDRDSHSPTALKQVRDGPRFDIGEAFRAWEGCVGRSIRLGDWSYIPLSAHGDRVALVAVGVKEMRYEQKQLADALCEQASIAVERTRLVDDLRRAQLDSETERLRSALLSSVSHDLRTPLASIVGSATSMLEYGSTIAPEDGRELLMMIKTESERLDRYIQNLLDMTRFGQYPLELDRDWVDLNDLIASAVRRLGAVLEPFEVEVAVEPDASLVFVQRSLMEQLLVNLLDNAAGFSPPAGTVSVAGRADAEHWIIEVMDEGPGISEADRAKIFDSFYRAEQGDRSRPGAGLGLAICLSVAAAHGGTIEALPRSAGGTCMRVSLPREQSPSIGDEQG